MVTITRSIQNCDTWKSDLDWHPRVDQGVDTIYTDPANIDADWVHHQPIVVWEDNFQLERQESLHFGLGESTIRETTVLQENTERRNLSPHIVVDPSICHGKPTFLGTRILVADVLSQVAQGMHWDTITDEWYGTITKEAISEAVRLAADALGTCA